MSPFTGTAARYAAPLPPSEAAFPSSTGLGPFLRFWGAVPSLRDGSGRGAHDRRSGRSYPTLGSPSAVGPVNSREPTHCTVLPFWGGPLDAASPTVLPSSSFLRRRLSPAYVLLSSPSSVFRRRVYLSLCAPHSLPTFKSAWHILCQVPPGI